MFGIEELLAMIVLFGVLFFGLKVSKKGEFHEDCMSLKITKGIQGYAAVGIMLHHMVQTLTNYNNVQIGPINVFNEVGYLFTGLFFFFSGYGLLFSLETKTDYLKHFLRKRMTAVLIPFFLINLIYFIYYLCLGTFSYYKFGVWDIIANATGVVLINSQMWFIVEIAILYLIFFLVYKLIKNRNIAYAVMGVIIVAIIIFSLSLGHDYQTLFCGTWFKGEWWYNSTILFFVGMTIAKFRDKIFSAIKKHYWIYYIVGTALFIFLFQHSIHVLYAHGYYTETENALGWTDKLLTLGIQSLAGIVGALSLMILTMKVQFNNKVLDFLGKIALELYMIHYLFLVIVGQKINFPDINTYFITIYTCSIAAAFFLHFITSKLIKLCQKKEIK